MLTITCVYNPILQSNSYIIEDNGRVVIVDPNDAEKIEELLIEKKWVPDIILLTHEHCDHIQGLDAIRDKYDVQVIACEACSKGIGNKRSNMSQIMEVFLYYLHGERSVIPYPPFICEPTDTCFLTETQFFWQGHRFIMTLVPGHTEGSCCICLDDTMLFSGDYLISGEQVQLRLPNGSVELYEKIGRPWLAELPVGMMIYPGHGKSYKLTRKAMTAYGL